MDAYLTPICHLSDKGGITFGKRGKKDEEETPGGVLSNMSQQVDRNDITGSFKRLRESAKQLYTVSAQQVKDHIMPGLLERVAKHM